MNTTDKRFQAAMAAMNGMLSGQTSFEPDQLCAMSVKVADALLSELDRTETKQPEPTIPAPPEGFTVWGEGPLPVEAEGESCYDCSDFFNGDWHGIACGDSSNLYALRDGSKIQRLNGRVKP